MKEGRRKRTTAILTITDLLLFTAGAGTGGIGLVVMTSSLVGQSNMFIGQQNMWSEMFLRGEGMK